MSRDARPVRPNLEAHGGSDATGSRAYRAALGAPAGSGVVFAFTFGSLGVYGEPLLVGHWAYCLAGVLVAKGPTELSTEWVEDGFVLDAGGLLGGAGLLTHAREIFVGRFYWIESVGDGPNGNSVHCERGTSAAPLLLAHLLNVAGIVLQAGYAAAFTTVTLVLVVFKLPLPQEARGLQAAAAAGGPPRALQGKVIKVVEVGAVATTPDGPLLPMGAPRAGQPAQQ